MGQVLRRLSRVVYSTIDVSEDAALGGAIQIEGYSEGLIIMPSAWTAADLGFKTCETEDGTFAILRDTAGVAVDVEDPAAGVAHVLPDALFKGTIWIKPWSKNATPATETDVNQAADRTIKFILR